MNVRSLNHLVRVAFATVILAFWYSDARTSPLPVAQPNTPRQHPGRAYEPADPRWAEQRARSVADPHWEWKCPIDFYGRVLDEEDRPVADASIMFSWTDLSPHGTSSLRATSDAQGYFALQGKRGKSMIVRVWKPYHYRPNQRLSFEYAHFRR